MEVVVELGGSVVVVVLEAGGSIDRVGSIDVVGPVCSNWGGAPGA